MASLKTLGLRYNIDVTTKIKELLDKIDTAIKEDVKKPTNLYLPVNLHDRATKIAKKKGISVSRLYEIVMSSVIDDLEKEKK